MKKPYPKTLRKNFYEKTGGLFFAIAGADGTVHENEIAVLSTMLQERWSTLDDFMDDHGPDVAMQIEHVFDRLLKEEKKSEDGFTAFIDFYKEHTTVFTDAIKDLIFETSSAIVNSFSGKNKTELIVLGKLRLLFTGVL